MSPESLIFRLSLSVGYGLVPWRVMNPFSGTLKFPSTLSSVDPEAPSKSGGWGTCAFSRQLFVTFWDGENVT